METDFKAKSKKQKLDYVEWDKAIAKIIRWEEAKDFQFPVSQEVPGYYNLIKKPMDFNTIKQQIKKHKYQTADEILQDVLQIIDNCKEFNMQDSDIYRTAENLEEKADKYLFKMFRVRLKNQRNPSKKQVVVKKQSSQAQKFGNSAKKLSEEPSILKKVKSNNPTRHSSNIFQGDSEFMTTGEHPQSLFSIQPLLQEGFKGLDLTAFNQIMEYLAQATQPQLLQIIELIQTDQPQIIKKNSNSKKKSGGSHSDPDRPLSNYTVSVDHFSQKVVEKVLQIINKSSISKELLLKIEPEDPQSNPQQSQLVQNQQISQTTATVNNNNFSPSKIIAGPNFIQKTPLISSLPHPSELFSDRPQQNKPLKFQSSQEFNPQRQAPPMQSINFDLINTLAIQQAASNQQSYTELLNKGPTQILLEFQQRQMNQNTVNQ